MKIMGTPEVDKYYWNLCSISSIPRIVPQARQRQCQVFLSRIYWELSSIADMIEIPSQPTLQNAVFQSPALKLCACDIVKFESATIAFNNHAAMQFIMSTSIKTIRTKRQFSAPIQRPSRWTPLKPVALMCCSTANASTVPPPAPFTPYHRHVGRMILFGATRCCLNHEMQ